MIDTNVELKLPEIAGICYRRFRGEQDFARMVALMNAALATDGVEITTTLEEKRNYYANLERSNPYEDELYIEYNDQLIAFGGIEWREDDEGNRIYGQQVVVDPNWRHLGLQRVLMAFNEARARTLAASLAAAQPKFVEASVPGYVSLDPELLAELGYGVVRSYYTMRHKLRTPWPITTLPAGITLRIAESKHLRAIWDAKEQAFADHWGHGQRSEADYIQWRDHPVFDRSLWAIAWDVHTNEIAGVSINNIYADENQRFGFRRGWVDSLGVRKPWRGRGLAKALLHESFIKLQDAGMTEVMLDVDATNPHGAVQLYEKMGFEKYRKGETWRKRI